MATDETNENELTNNNGHDDALNDGLENPESIDGENPEQSTPDESIGEAEQPNEPEHSAILEEQSDQGTSENMASEEWTYPSIQKKYQSDRTPQQIIENVTKYRDDLLGELKGREDLKMMWVDYRFDNAYYKSWSVEADRNFRKIVLMNKRIKKVLKKL